MIDINQVVLIGRLTKDAELKYLNTGTAITNFSIAVNRSKKVDGEWHNEASFFEVSFFGKQAESLNPYLKKGKQIGIVGELRQERWEKDGQSRSKVKIVAANVQLLGGKSQEPQV